MDEWLEERGQGYLRIVLVVQPKDRLELIALRTLVLAAQGSEPGRVLRVGIDQLGEKVIENGRARRAMEQPEMAELRKEGASEGLRPVVSPQRAQTPLLFLQLREI